MTKDLGLISVSIMVGQVPDEIARKWLRDPGTDDMVAGPHGWHLSDERRR